MTKREQELEQRVAELEREIAELKTRPAQEHHYHYHYYPQPLITPSLPTWPLQPEPYRITCRTITSTPPIGDTFTLSNGD